MTLVCPVCSATTKGNGDPFDSPRSVEAHISAKRDDAHSGKQGHDYREAIEAASTSGVGDQQDAREHAETGASVGDDPDPSEGGAPPESSAQDDADGPTMSKETEPDTVEMTPEEFDETLQEVEKRATEVGFEEGMATAEANQGIEVDDDLADSASPAGGVSPVPSGGSTLGAFLGAIGTVVGYVFVVGLFVLALVYAAAGRDANSEGWFQAGGLGDGPEIY